MTQLNNNTYKIYLSNKTIDLTLDEVYEIIKAFTYEIDFKRIGKVKELLHDAHIHGMEIGTRISR